MKQLLLLITLITCAFSLPGQEPVEVIRSTNKVIVEGKVYFIHIVEPGQTLYSIAKAYAVSQSDIVRENPGAEAGLRAGQALKIPATTAGVSRPVVQPDREFNIHVIKQGETIYSVSRLYSLSVERIEAANPGLDIYNLQIGQAIRIPVQKAQEVVKQEAASPIYHKVRKKETLYSISRKYGITVDELSEANPQLGWFGPKAGEILRIPSAHQEVQAVKAPEIIRTDSLLYLQAEGDSLVMHSDSLSADVQEDYLYDELNWEFYDPHKTYRIAFFIPFNYKVQPPLDTLLKDVSSAAKRARITESYNLDKVTPKALNFLEYYEGALLAVDSALKLGMKLEVSIYDTKMSMDRMRNILEDPYLEDLDLIIGPFYSFNVEIAAEFAREHRIPIVAPFYTDHALVSNNPYFFQVSPSIETECKMAAKYLAREYDKNLVFVHSSDSSEMSVNEFFKEQLYAELRTYMNPTDSTLKEVVLDNGAPVDLVQALSSDRKNIVISLTGNEAFGSQLISNLYFNRPGYDIELFASPYYVNFNNIDIRYFHALSLTLAHGFLFDYADPRIDAFMHDFYRNYHSQPNELTRKGISYGVLGFDMSFYFLMALRSYGPRFMRHVDELYIPQLFTNYKFIRVSRGGGYENEGLDYYRYTKDFSIEKVALPVKPEMHYFFRPTGDPDEILREN